MTKSNSFRPPNCKVSIVNNNNSILLRFSVLGVRQNLTLGLRYDSDSLNLVIALAYQIDYDIKHNLFVSKDKYKISSSSSQSPTPEKVWNLLNVFQFYCQMKPQADSIVMNIREQVLDWLHRTPNDLLRLENADKWLSYLRSEIPHKNSKGFGYSDKTIAKVWKILIAGVNLACSLNKITFNPLSPLYKTLTTKVSKDIRGYNPEQIQAIIKAFRDNLYCPKQSPACHSYYADFVEFRFLTGCRPSEAIALTFEDIVENNNRLYIRFNKRYVEGMLKKGLKNKKQSRYFPCNESLSALVRGFQGEGLIFKGVRGGYINADNFNRRYWIPVIDALVNDKILPFSIAFYDQRHCFGSLICRKTTDIKTVSSIMGNSPATLYRYYLADDLDFDVPEF